MKKTVLWFILVLLFSTTICSAAVTRDDFAINGIQLLEDQRTDIIIKIGHSKKEITDDNRKPPMTYLIYPGIRFGTDNTSKQIVYMQIDTRDYQTKRGITVGGTNYKVIQEYGEPERQTIKGHRYYIYHLESDPMCRLIFDMSQGYVSRIIFSRLADIP